VQEFPGWQQLGPGSGENTRKVVETRKNAEVLAKSNTIQTMTSRATLEWLGGTGSGNRKLAPGQFMHFQFMKVKPEMLGEYLSLWKATYLVIAEESAKQGQLISKDLYAVLYPAGEAAEYNLVMISRTANFDQQLTVNRHPADLARRLLPNVDMAEVARKRAAMRTIVREQIASIGVFAQE
jgi:hypothetical protein